jgi:hypothetical protein
MYFNSFAFFSTWHAVVFRTKYIVGLSTSKCWRNRYVLFSMCERILVSYRSWQTVVRRIPPTLPATLWLGLLQGFPVMTNLLGWSVGRLWCRVEATSRFLRWSIIAEIWFHLLIRRMHTHAFCPACLAADWIC